MDSIRPGWKNILQYEFGADQCKKQGKRESLMEATMKSDHQIELDVKDELQWDPNLGELTLQYP